MSTEGPNPLSHVIQHPLKQVDADVGFLTPEGKMTVFSDQISVMILGGLFLILFFPRMMRRRKTKDEVESLVPRGARNGVEVICSYLRDEIARPNMGEHTDRFIKYIWTIFFFILTMNLLGLVPFGAVTPLFGTHLGGTPTANIWVTATLAILTLLMMVINGLRLAPKDFIAHLCPGPLWLSPLLVPLELIGMLAKTFALTVRLFANMVAGHTLLAVLMGLILAAGAGGVGLGFLVALPVVLGSVAITFLEILVAFIQAFVFTFLTTVFIGQSIASHHEDHHEEAHA